MAISERRKVTLKAWRARNRDKLLNYYRQYRRDNPKAILGYGRRYRGHHTEEVTEYNRRYKPGYRTRNRERIAMVARARKNYRYKNDISYRLMSNCRSRLGKAIRRQGCHKLTSTIKLIGCSVDHLKQHLESLFTTGMSWKNHGYGLGKWHIDHFIPCAAFDLSDPEQQKKCFHWKNLQPMWHEDNLKKSDSVPIGYASWRSGSNCSENSSTRMLFSSTRMLFGQSVASECTPSMTN